MNDSIIEEREEFFTGNEWAGVCGPVVNNRREQLDKQVEEFLAQGGKIEVLEPANRNGPTMFNNRVVTFDHDKNSVFSRSEHDNHYKIRVYGSDADLVERIKELASTKYGPYEIMKEISDTGNPVSPSRFKRLVTTYLMDFKPAYRLLASYNDLPPSKSREIDQIALDALFEAYGQGLKKRAAWEAASEAIGFTVRAIIAIAHRRCAEDLWKKKVRASMIAKASQNISGKRSALTA